MPASHRFQEALQPRAMVERARTQSRATFAAEFADSPFLLVRLEDPNDELGVGLAQSDTSRGTRLAPTRDALGFSTLAATPSEVAAMGLSAVAPRSSFSPLRLRSMLVREAFFVVPLRKRAVAGKPFTDRISVGRAHNNDVVLRHWSVSKFHAWFECDDQGAYYVGDARSKNGTTLDGLPVQGADLARVEPGSEVRFGEIGALMVLPSTLWDALCG